MEYDRDEISAVVRRILLAADSKIKARVMFLKFHSSLPKGVCWGEEGPTIRFDNERRSASFTLTREPDDMHPMSIDVYISAEELSQTG